MLENLNIILKKYNIKEGVKVVRLFDENINFFELVFKCLVNFL